MFKKVYLVFGVAVCMWFTLAALQGWKSPRLFSGWAVGSPGRGVGGHYGTGWSGGK